MSENGLSTSQSQELLKEYGLNELPAKETYSGLQLLISQFKNVLSILLIVAAVLSFLVGEKVDGFLILLILVMNAGLGFWQEFKASKELEALRKLEVTTTRVLRDGKETEIAASLLVPGDIIILESGDKIPADATLLESIDLMINESALTGESVPVEKDTKDFANNTLFFGTSVTSGRGRAKIFATGSKTKFGKIALTLATVQEEQTPLEKTLDSLGKKVGLLAVGIAVFIFAIRIWQGTEIFEVFFGSVALMVAAVPEGLPAIITIALAFGVRRMYQKKTLVRRMSAVESLGGATVICTDKTGTLTLNQMRVKDVIAQPKFEQAILDASILCNSASLVQKEGSNTSFEVLGDSTEGSLLIWGKEKGVDYEVQRSQAKLVHEVPFSLATRMMTTVWQKDGKTMLYSKGAPEVILSLCKLSENQVAEHTKKYEELAAKGLRVLAVAGKEVSGKNEFEPKDLTFYGLVGIADQARPEVKDAIAKAHQAGIKVVMVTGDNELTAKAIGKEVGLLKDGDEVLTGKQLEELSDDQLTEMLDRVKIFARVVPEHKLRIVKAFQKKGEVVAVTGDGVNDSLALKQAEVGVAMGKTGTDVAKEASDLIILDDNFATIVDAIEEGRLIYNNIIKVVKFLLTGNLSEVLVILVAVILGLPIPFIPVQILWINFVTDGLPALALVVDPSSKHIMSSKPQKHADTLLSTDTFRFIGLTSSLIMVLVLFVFWYGLQNTSLEVARGWAFTAMVILQMIMVFFVRKGAGIASNKYLLLAVGAVLLIQFLIMSYPPLQNLFKIS